MISNLGSSSDSRVCLCANIGVVPLVGDAPGVAGDAVNAGPAARGAGDERADADGETGKPRRRLLLPAV